MGASGNHRSAGDRPTIQADGALYGGLAFAILSVAVLPLDRDLLRALNPNATGALASVALFVDHYLPRIVLGIGMAVGLERWFRGGDAGVRRIGLALTVVPLTANAVTGVVKKVVARPRPQLGDWDWQDLDLIVDLADRQSFPSGHVTTVAAFALVLSWLLTPRPLQGLVLLLIPIVMWDRCACMVHYPSDVLAGASLGFLFACGWRQVMFRWDPRPGPYARVAIVTLFTALTVFLWRSSLFP